MKLIKKKDTIMWKNNHYKFTWKDMRADGICTFREIPDTEEPMYLYYDFAIYEKKHRKWKKAAGTFSDDFPMIGWLGDIIRTVLNDRDTSKFQENTIHTPAGDNKSYSRSLFANSLFSREAYAITQEVPADEGGNPDWKREILFVTLGIKKHETACKSITVEVGRNELKELLDLAESVTERGREGFNADVREYIKENSSNKYIGGGILYCMDTKDAGKCQNLFTEGQGGSLYAVKKGKNGEEDFSCDGDFATIHKIGDNGKVTFQVLEYGEKKEINLSPQEILDFMPDISSSPRIWMNKKEIADDFFNHIMTPALRKEFCEMPLADLKKKYTDAVINMYWMCREEHPFVKNQRYGFTPRAETISKNIIRSIRRRTLNTTKKKTGKHHRSQ